MYNDLKSKIQEFKSYKYARLILSLVVLAVLFTFAWIWSTSKDSTVVTDSITENETANITIEDPLDVTMDFYNLWLEALNSTSTDPYKSGLTNLPILSAEVKALIEQEHLNQAEGKLEPVICQATPPKRVGGKVIYKNESSAQIMMFAREVDAKAQNQAVVTLQAANGTWQISKIQCTEGDVLPESEFDLIASGYLLKQSLQPPLDSQNWHLVFEENEKKGHVTPLFFDNTSKCVLSDGKEVVCDPGQFVEGTKVQIKADMKEEGATVKTLIFE